LSDAQESLGVAGEKQFAGVFVEPESVEILEGVIGEDHWVVGAEHDLTWSPACVIRL
jgi:hypothetical protein